MIVYGLGPIALPAYLDRNQVATRVSATEVAYAQWDRWAEPLRNNVSMVLLRNLGAELGTDDIVLYPWVVSSQIDRQIEEYQKRPRKKFIGARAAEYRFAQYEEDWRMKVERIGSLNYPAEARGKYYGNLRLTVTIRADGTVESIELDRSSGLKVLDAAAFRIVKMATPFAVFPADIRRDTDLLVITRTWFFGQGDKIWTESQ